jgi:hypothetical protein
MATRLRSIYRHDYEAPTDPAAKHMATRLRSIHRHDYGAYGHWTATHLPTRHPPPTRLRNRPRTTRLRTSYRPSYETATDPAAKHLPTQLRSIYPPAAKHTSTSLRSTYLPAAKHISTRCEAYIYPLRSIYLPAAEHIPTPIDRGLKHSRTLWLVRCTIDCSLRAGDGLPAALYRAWQNRCVDVKYNTGGQPCVRPWWKAPRGEAREHDTSLRCRNPNLTRRSEQPYPCNSPRSLGCARRPLWQPGSQAVPRWDGRAW